jgi:hypothetical protein
MVCPFFVSVYLNIFMREGEGEGERKGREERERRGEERGGKCL